MYRLQRGATAHGNQKANADEQFEEFARIRPLDIDQLCQAIGEAPSTIYEKVKLNKFPKLIKIGRKNKWRESTVTKFLDRLDHKAGN